MLTPFRRRLASTNPDPGAAARRAENVEAAERERQLDRRERQLDERQRRIDRAEADLRAPSEARAIVADDERPLTDAQVTATAQAILQAAAKRRGEIELELPEHPAARAIVMAARKARGEDL